MFGSNSHASHAKPSVMSTTPSKMSKLDLPAFSLIEPVTINTWLWICKDKYLAWPPAGRAKRETLLATWVEFASCLKDCFIPSGWRLDALACFYNVSRDLDDFVKNSTEHASPIQNEKPWVHFMLLVSVRVTSDATFLDDFLIPSQKTPYLRVIARS
ncbi:hypothetical protein BD769DRAFT_1665361 [Suillus cothurnatus]|nr:hypothetical protein BD769DRAFT_1665361 [Suillus cothurnatus]